MLEPDGEEIQENIISLLALEQIDNGIILIDQNRKIVLWNKWLAKTSSVHARDALNKTLEQVFPKGIKGRLLQTVDYALKQQLSSVLSSSLNRYVLPLYKANPNEDEETIAVAQSIVVKPTVDDSDNCYCLVHINDVTDVIKREALLKQRGADLKRLAQDKVISELRIRSIIENTLDSIITFDSSGKIITLNPSTSKIFNLMVKGGSGLMLQDLICELSQYRDLPIDGVMENLGYTSCNVEKSWPEAKGLRSNGQEFPIEISVTPLEANSELLYTAVIRDISERKKSEEKLTKLAQNDSLTGLANRALFYNQLEHLILRTRRSNIPSTLVLIDLDKFKQINDTMGHDVGDEVLKFVSNTLMNVIRDVDMAARLGGDEFAVILEKSGSPEHVQAVVDRIHQSLSRSITIASYEVNISSSMGAVTFSQTVRDSSHLIKCADVAMYYAKERGRDNVQFYTPQLRQISEVKQNLENSLHDSLRNQEFVLYYQPQFIVKTQQIVGAEALIRWNHPKFGLVPPDSFIPLLEQTGLIKQVGAWVLKEACEQCSKWLASKLVSPKFVMAVNFSGRQIKTVETANLINEVLSETNLSPANLEIELTESTLMEGHRNPDEILQELKNTGVGISIDDFGTGYSSLSYLKKFPIDNLKIDKSFVDDINENRDSAAIVDTIINLAQNLNLTVIAEGVEDKKTLDYLAFQHCDLVQGYLLAKPMCAEDFENFARGYKPEL